MRYIVTALAAACLAVLAAWLLVRGREAKRPHSGTATFEQRFPEQTAAYRQPAFVDARWHENRGHAWSLKDREETDPEGDPRWNRILAGRPKLRPQPAACLTCHAAGTPRAASYYEARDRRSLGCADCHDRPGDLRSAVCEQCHREYYIVAGQAAFPEGRTADQIEAFYEQRGIVDWTSASTGAVVLKAQHPQFEMYTQGPQARAGVACADCHMPFERRGATRITDHRATPPLENASRACLPCHRESVAGLLARVKETQRSTQALLSRAEDALVAAIDSIQAAQAAGAQPAAALKLETKAQWRIDFVVADHSLGFHAPQESARLLGEAIDYARQAQLEAARTR